MMKSRNGAPQPKNHIQTLMRVGYDFNAAVSDIIDNSISARAKKIWVKFHDKDLNNPSISICDDGLGMNEDELYENMIIGCKDTTFEREKDDLGRFGSGMKMASFSQARKLTVISKKKNSKICAFVWDIDEIISQNEWCLFQLNDQQIKNIDNLDESILKNGGTQLIWNRLPKLELGDHDDRQRAIEIASGDLKKYLALYFHKYLDKYYIGPKKVLIKIQGTTLKPIDPFLKDIDGYQEGPSEKHKTKGGAIEMQVHILPHHSHLTPEQIDMYGDLYSQQGLFIYRSKRLILAEGWLGVSASQQLGKLARIEIDIPASCDDEWQLDVQKSKVQLPNKIKILLKRLSKEPIDRSSREYKYRGKKEEANPYWRINKNERENIVTYEIQTDNVEFIKMAKTIMKKNVPLVKSYLKNLQKHLPIPHIYSQSANKPKSINQDEASIHIPEDVLKKLGEIWTR